MTKYDDFGRPIYETAEEYNRAHRAGTNTRTYEDRENSYNTKFRKKTYRTQRTTGQYTKQNTSKKTKVLLIGIAVYVSVIIVVLLFNLVGSFEDGIYEDNFTAIEEAAVDVDEEYLGDNSTPLPEGFETFSYNGQSYTLPTTMEEIYTMGFTLEEMYDENYILPTEYEESLILNDENGYAGMIGISNYTGEEIPLGKAQVNYFYIENPSAYEFNEEGSLPDFVFGDGFTFESSYEELEAYFGVPYYHYEEHSEEGSFYDSYEWAYYGEDEIHFVSITFWNGVISNVGIEKRVITRY